MNKMNILLLIFSFGIAATLTSCRKQRQEIVEEKRISGPLSDNTIEWSEADYK